MIPEGPRGSRGSRSAGDRPETAAAAPADAAREPVLRLDAQGREYARAVERHFRKHLDRPIHVSPKDVEALKRWYGDGIPLEAAIQGIDVFFHRHRDDDPRKLARIRSLRYCEDDVRTAAEILREARVGDRRGEGIDSPARVRATLDSLRAALEACAATLEAGARPTLAVEVQAAAGRIGMKSRDVGEAERDGTDPDAEGIEIELQELDRHLLHRLRDSLAPEEREALRRDAVAKLEGYRAAMTEAAFARTCGILEEKMLRERAALPRLSLYGF